MVTSAGKSTTMPLITATVAKPLPKISVMIGASATSGTVRTSIATGIVAASTPRESTIAGRAARRGRQPGDEADAGVEEGLPQRAEHLGAVLGGVVVGEEVVEDVAAGLRTTSR